MTTRRKFIQTSAALSTLAASEYANVAAVFAGQGGMLSGDIDRCVVDTRFTKALGLAAGYREQGIRVSAFCGNVGKLWLETLSSSWKAGPKTMVGVTGEDSLFVLEQLAGDYGMQVTVRETVAASGDSIGNMLVAWIIEPRMAVAA